MWPVYPLYKSLWLHLVCIYIHSMLLLLAFLEGPLRGPSQKALSVTYLESFLLQCVIEHLCFVDT